MMQTEINEAIRGLIAFVRPGIDPSSCVRCSYYSLFPSVIFWNAGSENVNGVYTLQMTGRDKKHQRVCDASGRLTEVLHAVVMHHQARAKVVVYLEADAEHTGSEIVMAEKVGNGQIVQLMLQCWKSLENGFAGIWWWHYQ